MAELLARGKWESARLGRLGLKSLLYNHAVSRSVKKSAQPAPKLKVLRASNLAALPWLLHGFSTRYGGVSQAYGTNTLNLGFTAEDSRTIVERNRRLFGTALGAATGKVLFPLVTLKQIHSDCIQVLQRPPRKPLKGDGLITNTPALLLGIQTADCLPILLVDTRHRAIAALHAGWRGTLAGIAEKAVGVMQMRFGSLPAGILAAIGPGIHACCYAVGHELRQQFDSQFAYAGELFHEVSDSDPVRQRYPLLFLTARAPGHSELGPQLHLDLVEANRRQLLATGVPNRNIEVLPQCTACNTDLLFSHRADGGHTGRMLAAVALRP